MIQNLINHIVFLLDRSGSMYRHENEVVNVVDSLVQFYAKRSQEVNQETRVSVYLFNFTTECLIYDMDVMRLPSLRGHYNTGGGTALIDATLKVINDLKLTPELYGDHAFLVFGLTDGEENSSTSRIKINKVINELPENWTTAMLVPDRGGAQEAERFGFPKENIEIWDVNSSKGVQQVGKRMQESSENFFTARSKGIRGTKSLFKLNVNLSTEDVKDNLIELSRRDYVIIPVKREGQIRDVVEAEIGEYTKGCGYYQLTKAETVQSYKQVCIRDRKTKKIYSGDIARNLLGFPNGDIRLRIEDLGKFDIFIQSTSVNRKILAGTDVLVINP